MFRVRRKILGKRSERIGPPKGPVIAFLLNPIIAFAAALILIIWGTVGWQRAAETAADTNNVRHDSSNLAHIIEQNIERTVMSLDSILKFMRNSYERSNYTANWPALISDIHASNGLTVQISVIDAKGIMISSSAMPTPNQPIDLSDREHYKKLRDAQSDLLFVSRPVIGRVSGVRTIQFARRLTGADGRFTGVVVASLSTDYLKTAFGPVSLGEGSGIALYGQDGIIRAGAGVYADRVEKQLSDLVFSGLPHVKQDLFAKSSVAAQGLKAVATTEVSGFPLFLRVMLHDHQGEKRQQTRLILYVVCATVATAIILYFAIISALNRRKYEAHIVRLAHFDHLTGVANRAQFKSTLESAYAEVKEGRGFALLLIDLDGFKNINDVHGHPIGDKLLQAVADRVQGAIRTDDAFARLGGDEFAIIQFGENPDQAGALARRLCDLVAQPFQIEDYSLSIGASIGIAFNTDSLTSSGLLKAADLALYEAKAAGRGMFRAFNRDMEIAFEKRRALEHELRKAIKEQQFEVYYQPIINIASGKVRGYEALIRWRHPVRGMVPPNDFIPIAEETGLIIPIGAWIIKKACLDIAQCDPELTVAVNCSVLQFRNINFIDTVASALRESKLEASRLQLEITESIFLSRDSVTSSCLDAMVALGVGLSLDDFGTGYSSLSYLMSYPFAKLKIDRSFTSQLCKGERGPLVVGAICTLASSLGMETVAEGVETVEQLEALRALGCVAAQGFLFSPPKPASQMLTFVGERAEAA